MSARLALRPILAALSEATDRAAPRLGSIAMRMFSDGSGAIYIDDGLNGEERELYRFENLAELAHWAHARTSEARLAIEFREQAQRAEREATGERIIESAFFSVGGVQ